MSRLLHPIMTPARKAWLEHLRDHGPAKRGKSPVGFNCMRLGWTEWNYSLPGGTPITPELAKECFGSYWFDSVTNNFEERITPAGRAALELARPDK